MAVREPVASCRCGFLSHGKHTRGGIIQKAGGEAEGCLPVPAERAQRSAARTEALWAGRVHRRLLHGAVGPAVSPTPLSPLPVPRPSSRVVSGLMRFSWARASAIQHRYQSLPHLREPHTFGVTPHICKGVATDFIREEHSPTWKPAQRPTRVPWLCRPTCAASGRHPASQPCSSSVTLGWLCRAGDVSSQRDRCQPDAQPGAGSSEGGRVC